MSVAATPPNRPAQIVTDALGYRVDSLAGINVIDALRAAVTADPSLLVELGAEQVGWQTAYGPVGLEYEIPAEWWKPVYVVPTPDRTEPSDAGVDAMTPEQRKEFLRKLRMEASPDGD